jgi:predicted ribosome quality control (RQC) complex YloA/Tae2 family protein
VHNNYYFLRQLSGQLNQQLVGFSIVSCFSQNKDELIIELNNSKQSFFIKASLLPQFCCLSFPESFNRARKNSIDLFPQLILKKVIGIRQFENERSFAFELEDDYRLLFKMHGNRSNLVLYHNQKAISLFRNHLEADLEISIEQLDRQIDFNQRVFEQNINNLPKTYFTFGKVFWQYWRAQGFDKLSATEQWPEFNKLLALLEKPTYYLVEKEGAIIFSLFPQETIFHSFPEPIQAINEFFLKSSISNTLHSEKTIRLKHIQDQLKGSKNYILKNQQKLDELVNDRHYQIWGDLIMAHMHQIKIGTEKIVLESFYDGKPVEIKLKQELNPQKNAELFYRKAKNQQIEINKLRETIRGKLAEIENLEKDLAAIEIATNFKELKKDSVPKINKQQLKTLPYHEFEFKGFKIWVGKNADHNDELTLKNSYKEDLWLHAKDVAGSHVLIKYQSGKKFPKDVIERAAQLAAYNSKRKTESLCPVIVTPKKFVRKRKGDPKGMVVVEREDVIMVEPKLN